MRAGRLLPVGCAATLLVAACAGASDDAAGSTSVEPDPGVSIAAATTTTPPTDITAPTSVAVPRPANSTEPAPGATDGGQSADQPPLAIEGVATMVVTTPASGNGDHPLLAWEHVASAATYALTLTRHNGEPYWAWVGSEPSVWLGGTPEQPPAGSAGPYLAEPMTLRIVAFDGDDVPIAVSPATEITP